jgi:ppGpp synthetase/RelA/SpoT-type nucleotidyltranferase
MDSGTGGGEVSAEGQSVRTASRGDVLTYATKREFYSDYARAIESVLKDALNRDGVTFLGVQSRAKSVQSFEEKASRLSEDGKTLKYTKPFEQLTDLAACRIIVFFPRTLDQVGSVISRELEVVEKIDHAASAVKDGRLGYLSVHYVCCLKQPRANLPEYQRFGRTRVEIQVRTVMQHAWAEIEHDIQYKSAYSVPQELARRFTTLAGLLEVADREFQSIQDRDSELRAQAREYISAGNLGNVELTASSLKEYLDKVYGPDGRMKTWSYEYMTKVSHAVGLTTIESLDAVVKGYDDAQISDIVSGGRAGQLSRLEYVLLAALPTEFVAKHPWADQEWFADWMSRCRKALDAAGIKPHK